MLEFFTKLLTTHSQKKEQNNLSSNLNIKFEDQLIDFKFANVGTYHAGSRTKRLKVN